MYDDCGTIIFSSAFVATFTTWSLDFVPPFPIDYFFNPSLHETVTTKSKVFYFKKYPVYFCCTTWYYEINSLTYIFPNRVCLPLSKFPLRKGCFANDRRVCWTKTPRQFSVFHLHLSWRELTCKRVDFQLCIPISTILLLFFHCNRAKSLVIFRF